jgi:hypothetical protein
MLAKEIRKASFDTLSLNEPRAKLAQEARDILGYKRLALAICTPGALLFQMRELNINPLDTNDVEAYKKSKEHAGMWSNRVRMWAWFTAFLVFTPFCAGAIGKLLMMSPTLPHVAEVVACILVICVTFIRACCNIENNRTGRRKVTSWYSMPIKEYNGFMPEHTIDKAVQIGKALPAAKFEVDYLGTIMEKGEKPLPDPDPFLRVSLSSTGECYYLDVWQEREFELYTVKKEDKEYGQ